jgi:hypothetical protein
MRTASWLLHSSRHLQAMADFLVLQCPHCLAPFVVLPAEINCAMFRHGAFVATGDPIPPHATEAECTAWKVSGSVYGCAQPFRVIQCPDGTYNTAVCPFI